MLSKFMNTWDKFYFDQVLILVLMEYALEDISSLWNG